MKQHTYIAIDLKSFYASVECRERGLDPLDTNLVVADESRTDKTICLAVTPSLKSYGISGRGRLFEVKQRVKEANAGRQHDAPGHRLDGTSHFFSELQANPSLAIDFIIAPPRMAYYMEYSTRIYQVYLKYIAPEGGKWVVKSKGNHARGEAEYPVEPQEGDEVVVLPTAQENPYFPIVGAVNAKASANGNNLAAQQYENPTPDGKCEVLYDVSLAWRQVEAVCDYIEYSAEGQRGAWGDAVTETPLRGIVRMNVSEFPEYLLFDAVPDTDYRSEVSGVATHTVSSSAIELYWNNNNTEDTAYDIFSSSLPETGYTLLKTVTAGLENMLTVSGLQPDTTYYYKVRPRKGDKTGTLSEYTSARTYSELPAPLLHFLVLWYLTSL